MECQKKDMTETYCIRLEKEFPLDGSTEEKQERVWKQQPVAALQTKGQMGTEPGLHVRIDNVRHSGMHRLERMHCRAPSCISHGATLFGPHTSEINRCNGWTGSQFDLSMRKATFSSISAVAYQPIRESVFTSMGPGGGPES